MQTMVGSAIFPRRLTQLFADTKKSYEHVVQRPHNDPEPSSLHLKLRIQKDRFLAWGFQWSDRSTAAHAGDIDVSLDRAGISDLVESIMCSIRDLLDEAEGLQLQETIHVQSLFPDTDTYVKSAGEKSGWNSQASQNPRRLEEILKDLTTSIDTLCDLSRSKFEDWSNADARPLGDDKKEYHDLKEAIPQPTLGKGRHVGERSPALEDDAALMDALTKSAYMEPDRFRVRVSSQQSTSSPPSYESIAAGSETRTLAYCSPLRWQRDTGKSWTNVDTEVPVLLDYESSKSDKAADNRPDPARFEEVSTALDRSAQNLEKAYSSILRLKGWTSDVVNMRCAHVYEIPEQEYATESRRLELQPRSLLSFLQNGGDADTNNMPSLENRFRLALNIVLSLMHLHTLGITHRSVNSNNVVFFIDRDQAAQDGRIWKTSTIRKPYITGFHQRASGSLVSGYDPHFSGIYHHPAVDDEQDSLYAHEHDHYSLGLILLEIGLWMPIGRFWKSKYTRADFKARLQDIYLKKLSAKCGNGYMSAVLYCMTVADKTIYGNHDQQNEKEPKFGDEAAFSSQVIKPLERCCLMDEDRGPVVSTELKVSSSGQPEQPVALEYSQMEWDTAAASAPAVSAIVATSTDNPSKQPVSSNPKIKVWSHNLPALYTKYWGSTMCPKLERILSKAISRWESYTIDLFMAGEDAETARPTVYMECKSTGKVRKILKHLNKDLRLFEIKVVPGQIVRSKAKKKRAKKAEKTTSQGTETTAAQKDPYLANPHYQHKPACGASIGAFRNGSHLPPVSFGGAVLVDGEPFGMSVHHMLEDDEELELGLDYVESFQRSMAPHKNCIPENDTLALHISDIDAHGTGLYPFEVPECPEGSNCGSSQGYESSEPSINSTSNSRFLPETLYPFEISDSEYDMDQLVSENDEFWLSPDWESEAVLDEDDDVELGDTEGVVAGNGQALFVTQPALDDVGQTFFPCEQDKDDEHLASHTLGFIHASSGIKRSRDDENNIHEVDWALIQINEERMPDHNIVQGGSRYCNSSPDGEILPPRSTPGPTTTPADSYPYKVMKSKELGGLEVHALGRTSGLQTGMILPKMRMVRMPGRAFASHSWQVRGNFGEGGDSGAWVIDNATNRVCGHVLAYSSASSVAYIAPMEVLLADMAATLHATITLPSLDGRASVPPAPSPPLPTSPPALLHELSSLRLSDMAKQQPESGSPLVPVLKGRSLEAGGRGARGKGRTMGQGGLEEGAGQVRARC